METTTFNENERSEHERRSWSAKCGHVKRKIFADEPLKGKTLDFALKLFDLENTSGNNISKIIYEKIEKGEVLSSYEKSIMEDAILTGAKLSGECLILNF